MNHLDAGLLRRALDEPHALLAGQRRHLDGCIACRRTTARLRANAATAAAALGTTAAAFAGHAAAPAPLAAPALRPTWWAASAAAAAALALLVAAPPVRTAAASFLAVFEPREFVAVPVSRADLESLHALPDLGRYGTVRSLAAQRALDVDDPARAAQVAGIPVRVPSFVPPQLPAHPQYRVMSRSTSAFTFDAAKAAAAAAAAHRPLPPLPRGIDGTTLQATFGPAVVALYATPGERARGHRRGESSWPRLAIAQMPVPVVISNGASAAVLLDYLASQPGLPPRIAAELRAIGDPAATLPIPIPVDRAWSTPVEVQGVRGLGVGDNTGVGAGVVWQRDGYVYGVMGALPANTILAIANSLR